MCPEDESVILSSFYSSIAALSVKQGEGQEKKQQFEHQSKKLSALVVAAWDDSSHNLTRK